jgi:hypothetical protein
MWFVVIPGGFLCTLCRDLFGLLGAGDYELVALIDMATIRPISCRARRIALWTDSSLSSIRSKLAKIALHRLRLANTGRSIRYVMI